LILVATMVVAGYFVFSASVNLLHSYRLHNDQARLQRDVEELRVQQDQLLQIRDYLRTDEYVEFMARRVFGLVKPGEVLVTVDAPSPPPSTASAAFDGKWWQRLFGR
jgi:cell division protein FtsB